MERKCSRRGAQWIIAVVLAALTGVGTADAALITHTITAQSDVSELAVNGATSDVLTIDPFVTNGINMGLQTQTSTETACAAVCVDIPNPMEFFMRNRFWVNGNQNYTYIETGDTTGDLVKLLNVGNDAILQMISDADQGTLPPGTIPLVATCTATICTATITQATDTPEPSTWLLLASGCLALLAFNRKRDERHTGSGIDGSLSL